MNWGFLRKIKAVHVLSVLLAAAMAAIIALLLRDVDLSPHVAFAREHAALAGAVIALASLVTVTFATWMNWRATRRQATLEAWTKWSDDTVAERKLISKMLGPRELTSAQAQALAHGSSELPTRPIRILGVIVRRGTAPPLFTDTERANLVHAAVAVLNGLERLAVGVELGVYRRAVLVDAGGTIIKRTFERFEPYIVLRRTHPEPQRRQEKAYVALEKLAMQIRYKEVDAERLESLRRQP